jgi:hypothetical protein
VVDIKIIMCQPAIYRFEWELEVSLTRLKSLGFENIVLLFSRHDSKIPNYIRDKYNVEVHVYTDNRSDRNYIPSIKPYLWSRYLLEDRSRENESYFYIDSDVLFREIPNVQPDSNIWYGSECSQYLSVDYIDSKGKGIFEQMCRIVDVDPEVIRTINPTAGAQWIISNPTYEYWNKVYEDSVKLYRYLDSRTYSDIQKWTAEMWAQLWNVHYFGKVSKVDSELEFCWATDDVEKYHETKIYHNAGVTEAHKDLFFKGKYFNTSPFKEDLSFVNKSKASIEYVKAISEVGE